ncbi:MAG: hypothetical protein ACI3YP_00010 [Prevotella sp.]
MTNKALKLLGLLIVCIMACVGITSCSSDDNPSEDAIPQLEQKLIGGMWLEGSLDKGNLVTIHFLEGNKAVFNVIMDSKEHVKQGTYSYEVKGNTIIFKGQSHNPKMTVKSFDDKRMDVEVMNFPEEGQTYSTTYIRRYPTLAENLGNTNWTLKKSFCWVEANKEQIVLPGSTGPDDQTVIYLQTFIDLFKDMMAENTWKYLFHDDNTYSLVTSFTGDLNLWNHPYKLDDYTMSCSIKNGDVEATLDNYIFKTEEGNLMMIFPKRAIIAYLIDFITLSYGSLTVDEWKAFADELSASLDNAKIILIFTPDTSGRNYIQENLTNGTWKYEDENTTEKLQFDSNGKMTNTISGNGKDTEEVYDYSVEGKKLTLTNLSGKSTYDIYFLGDQLFVADGNQTKVYTREIEFEEEN